MGDLARDELQATPWRLVVEEDPRRGVQPVALAVVHRDPVAVDLGHAVGTAGVERRRFALGDLEHLAEHLGRARLVEADLGVDQPDGVEHAGHAQGGRLTREHRLVPAGLHEGLGGQVVDLGRAVVPQHVDERDLVEQVAGDELDVVLDVRDALEVHRARAPYHADDRVALREQKFGEVRAVLAGDAGDQCPFCHLRNASPRGQRDTRTPTVPTWPRRAWSRSDSAVVTAWRWRPRNGRLRWVSSAGRFAPSRARARPTRSSQGWPCMRPRRRPGWKWRRRSPMPTS